VARVPLPPAAGAAPDVDALPYVDEHAVDIPAPRDVVWAALEGHVASSLRTAERSPLTRILGTEPRAGFAVTERAPAERLTLTGRHRFSRYALAFVLDDAGDGATRVRARTHAAFPGVHGRVYRALVIGTRAHVVATNHILRSVRRLSLELAQAPAARPAES
jgi:hypothetical protein